MRFELLCAGQDGPVEIRAEEEQPAPPEPGAPSFVSGSSAAKVGSVNREQTEAEDAEPTTSSQMPAEVAPTRPSATEDDQLMEQERRESKRQRRDAGLEV